MNTGMLFFFFFILVQDKKLQSEVFGSRPSETELFRTWIQLLPHHLLQRVCRNPALASWLARSQGARSPWSYPVCHVLMLCSPKRADPRVGMWGRGAERENHKNPTSQLCFEFLQGILLAKADLLVSLSDTQSGRETLNTSAVSYNPVKGDKHLSYCIAIERLTENSEFSKLIPIELLNDKC